MGKVVAWHIFSVELFLVMHSFSLFVSISYTSSVISMHCLSLRAANCLVHVVLSTFSHSQTDASKSKVQPAHICSSISNCANEATASKQRPPSHVSHPQYAYFLKVFPPLPSGLYLSSAILKSQRAPYYIELVCVCVCACVGGRERERE